MEEVAPDKLQNSGQREFKKASVVRDSNHVKSIEGYVIGALLGEGAFAKVRLATKDGHKYAMKMASKSYLRKMKENYRDEAGVLRIRSALDKMYVEIDVLTRASHPRIPKLYDVFEDDYEDKLYVVMQLAENNTLVDWKEEDQTFYIVRPGLTELSEKKLRSIGEQSIDALQYRTLLLCSSRPRNRPQRFETVEHTFH